ncbi:DUF3040 domain-containing protein [Lentzea aerocolonigenes]|uniref:DUF3040 domain-containing protein n=1 Tax=Lentzea aerocolonigenes TaxID=68170 RepID=UPI0004C2EE8B|nr:DUF3040 domain-containing protein [Lentzea aerocolonigenes]MCP2242420.1 Protein of unknown function (DUF3040) [Lentzea aerocolonigenes]
MDSSYEKQQLRQIENWFEANDPRLAEALSGPVHKTANRRSVRVAVDLLALALLVLGITTTSLFLVFTGLVCGMIGVCLHTTYRKRTR